MPRSSIIQVLPLLLALGCSSPSTPPEGPLQYHQQFAANVSTLYGTSGHDRKNLTDGYAPDFHWRRADSTFDSLSGHIGQKVMINFWATWCAPCKAEMPEIERLAQDMGDTVFVLGVSVDYPGNPVPLVQQYVRDHGLTYQFVVDSAWTLYNKYELWMTTAIPETMIVDTRGVLRFDITGSQTEDVFRSFLAKVQ